MTGIVLQTNPNDDWPFVDFAESGFNRGHPGNGAAPGGGSILPPLQRSGYWVPPDVIVVHERPITAADLKPFFLVEIKGGQVVDVPGEGFDDGADAAARAAVLTKQLGHKVQARRRKLNSNWHEVEAERLSSGQFSRFDVEKVGLPVITEHYAYLNDEGRVSYVPSEEYGAAGRRHDVTAGSYLNRFYTALSPSEVELYEARLRYEGQLQITDDPKRAVEIYQNGPSSCMSGKFKQYGEKHHPVEAYFAGDLALAYLEDNGEIIARCLIWPEKKLYTRAYGDLAKIKSLLRAEGYSQGDFFGAKMQRLTHMYDRRDFFILPFVDKSDSYAGSPASLCVVDRGDHFEISERFEGYHCAQTSGLMNVDRTVDEDNEPDPNYDCQRCGYDESDLDLSDVVVSVTGSTEVWCDDCRNSNSFRCAGSRQWVCEDVPNGLDAADKQVSLHHLRKVGGFICASSQKAFVDEAPVVLSNGATWSRDAFLKHGFTCAGNGRNYATTDGETIGGKHYSQDFIRRFGKPKEEAPVAANQDLVREPERLRA
ncbi:hypothetical protein [Methylobacterium indicum]|uniref:hypothetical protein n=1 Tax=Methylobacterium indicum TaxID=1775910 RepID=UPI001A938614|nr:hypothetical protein [Methylobacterium indicum]